VVPVRTTTSGSGSLRSGGEGRVPPLPSGTKNNPGLFSAQIPPAAGGSSLFDPSPTPQKPPKQASLVLVSNIWQIVEMLWKQEIQEKNLLFPGLNPNAKTSKKSCFHFTYNELELLAEAGRERLKKEERLAILQGVVSRTYVNSRGKKKNDERSGKRNKKFITHTHQYWRSVFLNAFTPDAPGCQLPNARLITRPGSRTAAGPGTADEQQELKKYLRAWKANAIAATEMLTTRWEEPTSRSDNAGSSGSAATAPAANAKRAEGASSTAGELLFSPAANMKPVESRTQQKHGEQEKQTPPASRAETQTEKISNIHDPTKKTLPNERALLGLFKFELAERFTDFAVPERRFNRLTEYSSQNILGLNVDAHSALPTVWHGFLLHKQTELCDTILDYYQDNVLKPNEEKKKLRKGNYRKAVTDILDFSPDFFYDYAIMNSMGQVLKEVFQFGQGGEDFKLNNARIPDLQYTLSLHKQQKDRTPADDAENRNPHAARKFERPLQ
ncbi:unnamed protein product, partial [Amoebophrya sp. A120]